MIVLSIIHSKKVLFNDINIPSYQKYIYLSFGENSQKNYVGKYYEL